MAPLIFIIVLSVLDVMRINIIIIGFLFEISELLLYFSIALKPWHGNTSKKVVCACLSIQPRICN